jgi:hypothetical protein
MAVAEMRAVLLVSMLETRVDADETNAVDVVVLSSAAARRAIVRTLTFALAIAASPHATS